jgi:hypothetical protein
MLTRNGRLDHAGHSWKTTLGLVAIAVAGLVASILVTASLASGAASAGSSGPVTCPPDSPFCIVQVENPGHGGSGSSSGGGTASGNKPTCKFSITGEVVPCHDPTFGWFNPSDDCYYQLMSPQPPASDPAWEGHFPHGAIYEQTCWWIIGTGGGWVWRATPPPGLGGAGITPAQLAQQALRLLRLSGPDIGMAPSPGSTGLVGVPVWMWTAVTPRTWGPASATASVPGLSVTATARAARIVWSMGDGHSVTCAGPGTPYTESLGAKASPTCGYLYATSSARQPGAKYAVTATTTWNVTWTGGGQSGALTVTRTSTTQVSIGELQVLVT